jgi:hypothetical protein
MNEKSKKTDAAPISGSMLSRRELLELHKRALEQVRRMTPEEGLRSLVASGIYTPEGKLAKEYGG